MGTVEFLGVWELVTSASLELDARKEDGVGGGLPDTLTQVLS